MTEPENKILENIARHVTLTPEEQEHFVSLLKLRKYKKRHFLVHEGEVAKYVAFVTTGCLRSYSIDANGIEHIIQFAPADWWITDLYSYISQKEGILNIDAVLDTEVLLLSRADQLQLFERIPVFERFFRIITEKSLVSSHRRLSESMSMNAMERYNHFCTYYPTLIDALPQKQIAAFIDVTPEFLSKMLASKA